MPTKLDELQAALHLVYGEVAHHYSPLFSTFWRKRDGREDPMPRLADVIASLGYMVTQHTTTSTIDMAHISKGQFVTSEGKAHDQDTSEGELSATAGSDRSRAD